MDLSHLVVFLVAVISPFIVFLALVAEKLSKQSSVLVELAHSHRYSRSESIYIVIAEDRLGYDETDIVESLLNRILPLFKA
ncbi:hypothetical protein FOZ63_001801 [Perkinsus olseni]|uniref:Uncharacterized protein n=1 Tax=Perkinsus olseni TaxID=32597 RepID=A0A7J6QUD1_PEROL|nr:hypothetical protein FOZ63_001801 [Perkinsus olseni]